MTGILPHQFPWLLLNLGLQRRRTTALRRPFHPWIRDGIAGEPGEKTADRFGRQDMIDLNVPKGVARHIWERGLGGILDDRQTAARANGEQAGGAAVELTGQEHADHPRAKFAGGRTKQRVDSGSLPVYSRAANHADVVAL